MIKNYLKVAWRNLRKNSLYSVINIGGLAIGMTVSFMLSLINQSLIFNNQCINGGQELFIYEQLRILGFLSIN